MNNAEFFVFESWREDREKEDGGVWHDCGKGLRVKVRSSSSQIVKDKAIQAGKDFRERTGKTGADTDDFLRLMEDVHAETLVVDWEGLYLKNGSPETPFSVHVSTELWKSRRWRDMIRNLAGKESAYSNEEEAQEKN